MSTVSELQRKYTCNSDRTQAQQPPQPRHGARTLKAITHPPVPLRRILFKISPRALYVEVAEAMLDVHPPHSPTHTWKDFFIHIATIVVGLIIAVGLEQTVEYIHHREQIKQAREALDVERHENIVLSQQNAVYLRFEHERYSGNLAALRFLKAHPHAELTDLPAPIQWGANPGHYRVAAWNSLRGGPIAALLPIAELQANENLYARIEKIGAEYFLILDRLTHATQYQFTTSDPRELSPAELDAEIQATLELLTQHYKTAILVQNLCDMNAKMGFKPCLTGKEIDSWRKVVDLSDLGKVYGAVGQARVERQAEFALQLDKIDADFNALEKQK